MTITMVDAADVPPESFPFRVTFLRDGIVLGTFVVDGPGVLQVPGYGPGCTVLIEYADGTCTAYREQGGDP